MSATEMNFHSADQTRHYLDTSLVASKVLRAKNGRTVKAVEVMQRTSSGTDAAKAVQFTWVRSTTNPCEFTLYAWKDNGSGGRTAATASTDITISALTD